MSYTKLFFTLLCLILISGLNAQNIVDGNVSMWGTTDYSGVKVIAHRFAPTTYMDSSYTNAAGYYSIDVPDGIYHFYFVKEGFENDTIADQAIYSNATMANVYMEIIGIFGPISGILHTGNYKVSDDLIVPEGDTLLIEPGVNLFFKYDVKFEVHGYLIANGTAEDSIIFTRYNAVEAWGGIKFYDESNDNSCISYARVSYSQNSGIYCFGADISVTNSVICYNDNVYTVPDTYNGGGLNFEQSTPYLDSLVIRNNHANSYGGGISIQGYGYSPNIAITNSLIKKNISNGGAGAVMCSSHIEPARLTIENTVIIDNYDFASECGGVKFGGLGLNMKNVVLANNSCFEAQPESGSLFIVIPGDSIAPIHLTNVVICGDTSTNAISCYIQEQTRLIMSNCIITGNRKHGIYYAINPYAPFIEPVIDHSCFWNNLLGDMNYDMSWFGDIVTTNANGIDCDAWSNIFVDPVFVDSLNGDYQLAPESPCIDAGNNDSVDFWYDLLYNYRIWDGNGDMVDVVDMGAYEFNSIFNGDDKPVTDEQPELSIYPNPTDGMVLIQGRPVNGVEVYSISGRKICSVQNVNTIDLSVFPSGVYYFRIKSDNTVVSRKVIKL